MSSKAFMLLGLLVAMVLVISSQVTARELAEDASSSVDLSKEVEKKDVAINDAKYSGGGNNRGRYQGGGGNNGGGYQGGGGNNGGGYQGGGGNNGGGYQGGGGNNGGYHGGGGNNGGGYPGNGNNGGNYNGGRGNGGNYNGGRGNGCRHGCCGYRNNYRGGCRCCTFAGENVDAQTQN